MSPSELLRKLQNSDLFSPDFPKRIRYTHAEWAALPEDAMRGVHAPGIAAISRATNYRELDDIVRELGRTKYEPAVPTLTALWNECALVPVRIASGHALREIGSPEARAALQTLIEASRPTFSTSGPCNREAQSFRARFSRQSVRGASRIRMESRCPSGAPRGRPSCL